MAVEFLNIKILWITLVLPILLGTILWGLRRRRAILGEFGRMELLAQFSRFSLNRKMAYQSIPAVLCFALLITVAARPFLSGDFKQIKKGSLDVVAVLDVSKSMAAEDCGPGVSRIEMAKETLLDGLPALTGNRLGLVAFAGKSFPQAELTDDFQALRFVLKNWVAVDSAPSQGSNIGAALSEAVSLFEKDDKRKVILFLSDGGHVRPKNLVGILTDLQARDIGVVSVGVGSVQGSKIPVYENGAFKEWFKIKEQEAVTRLNEAILKEISETTGGKYFHLDTGRELKGIFRDPGIVGKKVLSGGREVFQVPLALSVVLLCAGMYLERRSG
jgi:Ca-activated chloride channel family protein